MMERGGREERSLWLSHGALTATVCRTDQFSVKGVERAAGMARGQMKGDAEIHSVRIPLQGGLHAVRAGKNDIGQAAQFGEGFVDRRGIEAVRMAQDPFRLQHDGIRDKDVRFLEHRGGFRCLSGIISRKKPNKDVGVNAGHASCPVPRA